MSATSPEQRLPYRYARPLVRDGDVLLFRRRPTLQGLLIAAAGRSEYGHAALAAWWGDCLLCLEARQFAGTRAVALSSLVGRRPIDVYRVDAARWPEFRPAVAVARMRRLTGTPYGWGSLLRAALRHLPVVRLFARPDPRDTFASGRPPYCSEAVAAALRQAGVDPVPNLADRLTEPADLARSSTLRYQFTLTPSETPPCAAYA